MTHDFDPFPRRAPRSETLTQDEEFVAYVNARGGPAFPLASALPSGSPVMFHGATVHDCAVFAALTGLLANPNIDLNGPMALVIAKANEIADAVVAERGPPSMRAHAGTSGRNPGGRVVL